MAETDGSRRWAKATGFLVGMTVLLVAACGGSEAKTDEAQIQDAVRTFFNFTFLGKGDDDKAYDLLDADSKANCSKEDFVEQAKSVRAVFGLVGASAFKLEKVSDIKVTGDTATAKIDIRIAGEPSDSADEPVPFKKEDGKWRISEGC